MVIPLEFTVYFRTIRISSELQMVPEPESTTSSGNGLRAFDGKLLQKLLHFCSAKTSVRQNSE